MRSAVLAALAVAAVASPALAADPTSVPVLGKETPRGTHSYVQLPAEQADTRVVDGSAADWSGTPTGFGGTLVRSRGELVYQDHLFDAYGADDGGDADALLKFDDQQALLPETYRLEAIMRNDPAGQVGAPNPEQLQYAMEYGDLPMQADADLSEVRVGVQGNHLWFLGRTTSMRSAADTGMVVLLDTAPGTAEREVGFGTGLKTTKAESALLFVGDRGFRRDLATGAVTELGEGLVATNATGYANTIEAKVNRNQVGADDDQVGVAVMTGKANATGDGVANVANVAFRTSEPVREFFERNQALALHAGSVDGFFTTADLAGLARGANERWVPGPGYHDRIFRSTENISAEGGADSILQHYGVYLPKPAAATAKRVARAKSRKARRAARAAGESSLQLWLHWRGGTAHSAGATIPRMFTDLGDEPKAIVISPRGRGSSSWYVGKGHLDVMQVWEDVHRTFAVDPDKRYVAGHSMGGWGSFLFSITHPDWFAAGLPASPPVTQGAWTGADFPGCDEFRFDDYSPCYIQANDGDARTQHTRRLLENVRHVPWAIYHGLADELVPYSGVTRQVERLVQLGYRHRYYTFPTQEHFGPPVWDQWAEGAAYMHSFTRPANPSQVTYVRDMPFEKVIETANKKVALDIDFDQAYWMSALTPADPNGVARFDGRSLAIAETPHLARPEAGGPVGIGQTGPFAMVGLAWLDDPLNAAPAKRNGFELTLAGTKSVRLDLERMQLDPDAPIAATIATDVPVEVELVDADGDVTVLRAAPGTSTQQV
jgi:pimeloyl-ACP methyl ester carboxylesterase